MKSLVLAEKPSVGKDLARVLKCTKTHRNFCEGSKYVVTWALGHLVTLAEPQVYDQKLKEWRMEDLPMLPEKMKLKIIKQTSQQFRAVNTLMKRNDIAELIIATDAGREGELVARWIMKLAGWKKKPFTRLWISSQTDEAIRKGFATLTPGKAYDNLFYSAVCRAEADWLIGLNITRALTCKFNASLNAGRVQTPTLSMIVNREQGIKNFRPVDYWRIQADFGDYLGSWRDKHGNARIFEYAKAKELATNVEGQTGVIEEVSVKNTSEAPPLAYDLTELQRDANRIYGFSAKKTLSVLQKLYERYKLVTYPRTDSRYITSDMVDTLPQRLKSIATIRQYVSLVGPLLQKKLSPGKRFVNNSKVSDHHAIIPTEQVPNLKALSADEQIIYHLIVKRFLAVLYPPYRYEQITIVTLVKGKRFYSQGKVEKEKGWKVITSGVPVEDFANDDDLPQQVLHHRNKGEQKNLQRCTITQSKTVPPPRYTEATLLTAMESPGKFIEDEELRESIKAGGLGTPATRAEIIEKLVSNYYIERSGKSLVPTSKAFKLLELVPSELKSPELTATWELRLAHIAKGQESGQQFMADIRQNAVELVKNVRESTATYTPDNLTQTKCPLCGQLMMLVKAKKGKKLVCSDRRCGYEESEQGQGLGKRSKKEQQMNKRLIRQYSDHATSSTSLGNLLQAALDKKEES